MSHVRTQIRQATAAALAGIAPVSVSRVWPVEDLPVLLVYTNDEEIEGGTIGAYQRTVDLVIEICAKGETYDDDLDALLVLVEQALNKSKLGGLCKPLALTEIRITVEQAASMIGRAKVTYRAIYFTEHSTPDTAA
jgi:hypothetical protein